MFNVVHTELKQMLFQRKIFGIFDLKSSTVLFHFRGGQDLTKYTKDIEVNKYKYLTI